MPSSTRLRSLKGASIGRFIAQLVEVRARYFMSERKLRQDADRWYRQATDDLEAGSALLLAKKVCSDLFLYSASG